MLGSRFSLNSSGKERASPSNASFECAPANGAHDDGDEDRLDDRGTNDHEGDKEASDSESESSGESDGETHYESLGQGETQKVIPPVCMGPDLDFSEPKDKEPSLACEGLVGQADMWSVARQHEAFQWKGFQQQMDVQAVHSQQAAPRCGGHGEFSCEETRCISVKIRVRVCACLIFSWFRNTAHRVPKSAIRGSIRANKGFRGTFDLPRGCLWVRMGGSCLTMCSGLSSLSACSQKISVGISLLVTRGSQIPHTGFPERSSRTHSGKQRFQRNL